MIVCVACSDPGGLEAVVGAPFELTAVLDCYDIHSDGYIEHLAQMGNCGGSGCINPVEAVKRRGVEKVIVTGLSPGNLLQFHNSGIRVLRTENPSVPLSFDALIKGELKEIAIDQFPRVSKHKT